MKQHFVNIIFCLLALGWVSCNSSVKQENVSNSFTSATNGLELDKRLLLADSLGFVFYNDPYGDDSLRYTRYYTQLSSSDSNDISLLKQNLQLPFSKFEKVKNCRSEGKIWCYEKGKIFQTVYFSTRCDDCCFIYLIKDGYFFYMNLGTAFSERLSVLKPLSKSKDSI